MAPAESIGIKVGNAFGPCWEKPRTSELDLRTYPTGNGLGLFMTYDLLGYDEAEAHDILREVIERLSAGQPAFDVIEQAAV